MLTIQRFSFLLPVVCLSLVSSDSVPTNVSVTCHNFKHLLYWNYTGHDPKPKFCVQIRSYEGAYQSVQTNETFLDISEYSQNAVDTYYVTVETSPEKSESIFFSYSDNMASSIRCMLDFPKLEVSVFKDEIELFFTHPYYVYNADSFNDVFNYVVLYNQTEYKDTCYVDDDPCSTKLHLYESLYMSCMKVTIKGSDGIPFETFIDVCGNQAPGKLDQVLFFTILVASVVGLLLVLILGVKLYKKLTKPDSQTTILSKILRMVNSGHVVVADPEQPALSEVKSVGHTPLLENTEQTFTDPSILTSEEDSQLPTHFPTGFTPDVQLPDEPENEDDSEDFNSGNSFSGYDCQKFPIDMGQGDIVEAYGPR